MDLTKDITVNCKSGDLELRYGRALCSFYFKGQEKFVFKTEELDEFVKMIQAAKDCYERKD